MTRGENFFPQQEPWQLKDGFVKEELSSYDLIVLPKGLIYFLNRPLILLRQRDRTLLLTEQIL